MVFDAEIPLKEIDHRQVARRLAIGDRTGLEDEPTLHAMRVGDFPDQARLAYAGFPHYGDDLPTASCGTCERLAESLKLNLPPDELGEPSRDGGVEAGPAGARADQLVDIDGLLQSLHRHQAKRPHLEISVRQTQCFRGESDSARRGELFHPRGQVRRLAHGGVVHAKVAADGADYDLTRT